MRGGISPQCLVTTIQLDLPGERWGVTIGLLPTLGITPRYYLPFTNINQKRWKPYVYGGFGFFPGSLNLGTPIPIAGVGIGTDICLGKSKRLILQPTVGVAQMEAPFPMPGLVTSRGLDILSSASLSIMYEFGK